MSNVVALPKKDDGKGDWEFYMNCAKDAQRKVGAVFVAAHRKEVAAEKRRMERAKRKKLLARIPKMKKRELRRHLKRLLSK